MSLGEFFRKSLVSFFIIVTCLSVVIGILGLIYEPERRFGYEAYFSPIIFGLIGIIPSIVTYSKKELTLKQMAYRKVFQLIVIEAMVLSFGYVMGAIEADMMSSVAVSVFIVYLVVHLITWLTDSKKASELNEELRLFQEKI